MTNLDEIMAQLIGPSLYGGIMWVLIKALFSKIKSEFDEIKDRLDIFEEKLTNIDKELAVKASIIDFCKNEIHEMKAFSLKH
jgi:hypothetical protein